MKNKTNKKVIPLKVTCLGFNDILMSYQGFDQKYSKNSNIVKYYNN